MDDLYIYLHLYIVPVCMRPHATCKCSRPCLFRLPTMRSIPLICHVREQGWLALSVHLYVFLMDCSTFAYICDLMPHFIIFEISRALNNDVQADCSDLFRFLIGLSIPKL